MEEIKKIIENYLKVESIEDLDQQEKYKELEDSNNLMKLAAESVDKVKIQFTPYQILENSWKEKRLQEIGDFCKYLENKYPYSKVAYNLETQEITIESYEEVIGYIHAELEAIKTFIKL